MSVSCTSPLGIFEAPLISIISLHKAANVSRRSNQLLLARIEVVMGVEARVQSFFEENGYSGSSFVA